MIAWPRPADAAIVPCSISVQAAMASTLAIDTDPDVRPIRFGTPTTARAVMGSATGHPVTGNRSRPDPGGQCDQGHMTWSMPEPVIRARVPPMRPSVRLDMTIPEYTQTERQPADDRSTVHSNTPARRFRAGS